MWLTHEVDWLLNLSLAAMLGGSQALVGSWPSQHLLISLGLPAEAGLRAFTASSSICIEALCTEHCVAEPSRDWLLALAGKGSSSHGVMKALCGSPGLCEFLVRAAPARSMKVMRGVGVTAYVHVILKLWH